MKRMLVIGSQYVNKSFKISDLVKRDVFELHLSLNDEKIG